MQSTAGQGLYMQLQRGAVGCAVLRKVSAYPLLPIILPRRMACLLLLDPYDAAACLVPSLSCAGICVCTFALAAPWLSFYA